jgi:hypothetical protein
MPDPTLIVPITCEALVANDGVIARDGLRWWPFNYLALTHFRSPQPAAFDRGTTGQKAGIYLHWTLPAALREGVQDSAGAVEYPLVPNRWLVVRVQGTGERLMSAWVLESDCPFTSMVQGGDVTRTSQYLVDPSILQLWSASGDPFRTAIHPAANAAVQTANIGVPFPASGWTERARSAMFLKAVAPANPLFSGYFPHHLNVFGFYDDLARVDQDTLSYYVIGWSSDPARDILAPGPTASADLLANLRWTVASGDATPATRTLYSGGCFAIPWRRSGNPPAPDPLQAIRDSGKLNVAVGNTTMDAFSALVGQQITNPGVLTLLQAFNYGLLPMLNEMNGPALLAERIRQEWFGSRPGGSRWIIVDRESNGEPSTTLTGEEAAWLAQLNADQAALDEAVAHLASLQWTVQALWLKRGYLSDPANVFPAPPGGAPPLAQLDDALDATRPGTAASALVAHVQTVRQCLARVPQPVAASGGTAQDAFQAGITAFAAAKALGKAKRLKAVASPRYWRANNPVIVLSGVDSPYDADPKQPLVVRPVSSAVTGVSVDGTVISRQTAGSAMPLCSGIAAMPGGVGTVLDELFLLDPANAPSLAQATGVAAADLQKVMTEQAAAAFQGIVPAEGVEMWAQPWQPLIMEWRGSYLPIPAQTNGSDNWTFDGTDYHFTGTTPPAEEVLSGISLLSPHAQLVFGSRLKKFLQAYGDQSHLQDIDTEISKIFGWRFLAQELVGFNEMLALRDGRAFRRPASSDLLAGTARSLAALLGFEGGADALPAPLTGRVSTVPRLPNGPALPFQGIRQGQLYLTDVILYDRFGRTLILVSSTSSEGLHSFQNFPAVLDRALQPANSLMPEVQSVLELPPRPLQHARMDVQFVDRLLDTKLLSAAPDACPVCAWILPNHLGGSLLIYAPDGTRLGQMRLAVGADGVTRMAEWAPPVDSTITQLSDLAAISPHLVDFLQSPSLAPEANFTAFLSAIDATLWTVDPLGGRADRNLSVMVGRPLALVRLRLGLELDGDALCDTGWAATFDTSSPAFLAQKFALRLGDQATRQDGTVGYFAGIDYAAFNSVVPPDTRMAQDYVRQIGPLQGGQNYVRLSFTPGDTAFLTVLMDPRASMHVTSGILPVKQIDLPPVFVDGPLSNIEIGFDMGPVLTFVQPSPAQGGQPPAFPLAVTYPRPVEQQGTWAWWEASGTGWTGYGVLDATPTAAVPALSASLREGTLQLAIDLNKEE